MIDPNSPMTDEQIINSPFYQLCMGLSKLGEISAPPSNELTEAFERTVGAAILEAVSEFYRFSNFQNHIYRPILQLGIALLDRNKAIASAVLSPDNVIAPDFLAEFQRGGLEEDPHSQLMADLQRISQSPQPKSENEYYPTARVLAAAVLKSVSRFYSGLGDVHPYLIEIINHLASDIVALNRGIQTSLFAKPPNTKKTPDPVHFWLMRAEIAALLQVLIDKGQDQNQAALKIFNALQKFLPRITSVDASARDRKDKPAKKPMPEKLIVNWLSAFNNPTALVTRDKPVKNSKKLETKIEVSSAYEDVSFGDFNFLAMKRFDDQRGWLTDEYERVPERERSVWINERLRALNVKLKTF